MTASNTHIMPAPTGEINFNFTNGNNKNIISTIHNMYDKYRGQTRYLAIDLAGDDVLETCKNIWDFVKDPENFNYIRDLDPKQIVKSPANFYKSKTGDCKSYALFVSSLLYNLGIPHGIRYASYNGSDVPSHVYVAAKDENGKIIIIDGTINRFNYERPQTFGIPTKVITYWVEEDPKTINGAAIPFNYTQTQSINGVGDWLRRNWQSAKDDFKKYNPLFVLARNAFRTLVSYNVFNLARRLAMVYGANQGYKVVNVWEKNFGGNPQELEQSIRNGQPRNPIFSKKQSIGFIQEGIFGDRIGEPITIGALTAAASAIMLVLKPILDQFSRDPEPEGTGTYDPNDDIPMPPSTQEGPFNPWSYKSYNPQTDAFKYYGLKYGPWIIGGWLTYKYVLPVITGGKK